MPSLASETDIHNMALDLLDEEPILSAGVDDRTSVRFMRRAYATTRDAMLEMHPWKFAVGRAAPAAGAEPAFGWAYSYALPNDCLRVLPLTASGDPNGAEIPYALESGGLLTNHAAPIYLRYIARIEDTTKFSNLFVKALACSLAEQGATKITGKASYQAKLIERFQMALLQAQMADTLQSTPEQPYRDAWENARYGT